MTMTVEQRERLEARIAGEVMRILVERRGGFDISALRRFINEAGFVFAVPAAVTPRWVHGIAEAVVSDFDGWLTKQQGTTLQ
jgi:hypothetical protein